jgi:hypothetical protein
LGAGSAGIDASLNFFLMHPNGEPPMKNAQTDRPLAPWQILVTFLLFGPLAGGIVTALNCRRLKQQDDVASCLILGVVTFLVQAVLLYFFPCAWVLPVVFLTNFTVALVIWAIQHLMFEEWQREHWRPTKAEPRYKPNTLDPLIGVGLGCWAMLMATLFYLA